jgi:hypothetical protein
LKHSKACRSVNRQRLIAQSLSVEQPGLPLFESWTYDSQGRATSSQHAGGADLTKVTYTNGTCTTVTDARGRSSDKCYFSFECSGHLVFQVLVCLKFWGYNATKNGLTGSFFWKQEVKTGFSTSISFFLICGISISHVT